VSEQILRVCLLMVAGGGHFDRLKLFSDYENKSGPRVRDRQQQAFR
jgi:hypothetical protein